MRQNVPALRIGGGALQNELRQLFKSTNRAELGSSSQVLKVWPLYDLGDTRDVPDNAGLLSSFSFRNVVFCSDRARYDWRAAPVDGLVTGSRGCSCGCGLFHSVPTVPFGFVEGRIRFAQEQFGVC